MEDFDIGLYDYQLDAIKRLKNGSVLWGDVGTGKSRTSLGYYFIENGGSVAPYREMKDPCDLYIITTARKRDTCEWDVDMAPFLLSQNPKVNHYDNKIVIDSWNNIGKYKDVKNAFFIMDEQRLVGYGSWAKSFLKIAQNNKWILLTATPGDTWSDYMVVFIANGFYKNKTDFIRQHAIMSPYVNYEKIQRYVGTGKLIRLRKEVLVHMQFEKPTIRHYEEVVCDYSKKDYETISKNRWNPWTEEPIEKIPEMCYLLRKVTNNDPSRIAAMQYLASLHERVIVFYNFDYELEALKNIEYKEGTVVREWNGHRHEEVPTSERWVYLVQYASGCEAWNCTTTDTLIFYSQNYSYKTTFQASGRIDRLNTPYKDLYYYTLRSDAPIDLAIKRALRAKKTFNEKNFIG